MEKPSKQPSDIHSRELNELSPYEIASADRRLEKVADRLEKVITLVGEYKRQAIIEVTKTIGEPRLTQYMQDHVHDGELLPSEDFVAILSTIDSSLPKQVLDKTGEIQKADHASQRQRMASRKRMGKAFLHGMTFGAFPRNYNPRDF